MVNTNNFCQCQIVPVVIQIVPVVTRIVPVVIQIVPVVTQIIPVVILIYQGYAPLNTFLSFNIFGDIKHSKCP